MPLVGTICCQDGQPHDFDYCKTQCRQGGCNHTLPLLSSMQANGAKREGVGLSASLLSGCPRQFILAERNDYYEDPERWYARWLGTAGHSAIEHGGPYEGILSEVRFYRSIDTDAGEIVVSGQTDWYDEDYRRLEDFKFVAFAPKALKPDHEFQVNVYAWILEGNGKEVDSAGVNYYHAGRTRHTTFEVPLWTQDAIEDRIRKSLQPHADYATTGNLSLVKAPSDFAWGASCPFRHPCNPGRCCQE